MVTITKILHWQTPLIASSGSSSAMNYTILGEHCAGLDNPGFQWFNKLASLEATLVRNSAQPATD